MIRYEDISTAIQVRHLQVELSEAVTFQPGDAADVAAQLLSGRGFDQAPVLDGHRIVGIVRTTRLRDGAVSVADRLESIDPEHLVSADTPVSRALEWLRDTPCLFVLSGRRITGFFVEADLNKQPARTYFYLLVASLEAGLARLIREWTRSDEARLLGAMPARVRDRALKARADARIDDSDTDLVSYLLFSDILRVIEGLPVLRQRLGATSQKKWHSATGPLVGLRNAVMHPTRDLVGRDRSLERLIELDGRLHDLLNRLDALPLGAEEAP